MRWYGRTPWILAVLSALLTAGCLGLGGQETEDEDLARQRAAVTEDLGGIEGVVTDEAVQPIEGANVTLAQLGETTQTAQDGSYAFSRLQPGTYTLVFRAEDFISTEQTVDVRAGSATPVDVILTHLAEQDAFTQQLELAGFFECGFEVGYNVSVGPVNEDFFLGLALCAVGGNATNDQFNHLFSLEAPLDTLVHEMTWDAQNRFSDWMTVRMEVEGFANDGIGTIYRTQGPSPIQVRLDNATWQGLDENFTAECEEGDDDYCGYGFRDQGWPLQTRVFPAWQCFSEQAGGCAVLQQPFTHIITAFYNAPAPEGYSALRAS